MNTLKPATTAQEVSDLILPYFAKLTRFLDKEEFDHRVMLSKIDKLIGTDAAIGWFFKSVYFTMFWKREDALAAASNALRLTSDPQIAALVATSVYMNLAEQRLAQKVLCRSADPRNGFFSHFINSLISFLIIAAVVYFFVVLPVNRLMARFKPTTAPAPTCAPRPMVTPDRMTVFTPMLHSSLRTTGSIDSSAKSIGKARPRSMWRAVVIITPGPIPTLFPIDRPPALWSKQC